MTPKQIHIACDFLLLIPTIGILLSIFIFTNKLDTDMSVLKDLLANWKKKPIHLVQDSYQKECEEIGMSDIIGYNWPGTHSGCHCPMTKSLTIGKCIEKETQLGCKSVEEVYPYTAKKWKTRFLCATSIKSKPYFEAHKVAAGDTCAYKYKKCGVIDTLGNHLCIPENENCPLNSIVFRNTVDEQNVRIDTSNSKENGKIYTNFVVAEERICVNGIERDFAEKDYPLLKKSGKELEGCRTYIREDDLAKSTGNPYFYSYLENNNDRIFEKLDSYPKKLFYDHNVILPFVTKNLPLYPVDEIKTNVSIYGSVFVGWKKECEKKEFNLFRNGDIDTEINAIILSTDEYNFTFTLCALILAGAYFIGAVLIKYSRILSGSYKIEITSSTLALLILTYLSISILDIFLFYYSDVNLDVIKNAKLTNDFFEMISIRDCSDPFTNALLKHTSNMFFLYANRYFNIKILSFFSLILSIMLIFISIFAKPISDSRRKRNYY